MGVTHARHLLCFRIAIACAFFLAAGATLISPAFADPNSKGGEFRDTAKYCPNKPGDMEKSGLRGIFNAVCDTPERIRGLPKAMWNMLPDIKDLMVRFGKEDVANHQKILESAYNYFQFFDRGEQDSEYAIQSKQDLDSWVSKVGADGLIHAYEEAHQRRSEKSGEEDPLTQAARSRVEFLRQNYGKSPRGQVEQERISECLPDNAYEVTAFIMDTLLFRKVAKVAGDTTRGFKGGLSGTKTVTPPTSQAPIHPATEPPSGGLGATARAAYARLRYGSGVTVDPQGRVIVDPNKAQLTMDPRQAGREIYPQTRTDYDPIPGADPKAPFQERFRKTTRTIENKWTEAFKEIIEEQKGRGIKDPVIDLGDPVQQQIARRSFESRGLNADDFGRPKVNFRKGGQMVDHNRIEAARQLDARIVVDDTTIETKN